MLNWDHQDQRTVQFNITCCCVKLSFTWATKCSAVNHSSICSLDPNNSISGFYMKVILSIILLCCFESQFRVDSVRHKALHVDLYCVTTVNLKFKTLLFEVVKCLFQTTSKSENAEVKMCCPKSVTHLRDAYFLCFSQVVFKAKSKYAPELVKYR